MSQPEIAPQTRSRAWYLSLAILLLLLLGDAGGYWWADLIGNPQAGVWERAMFRPGGDPTYYGFFRAQADGSLGEAADYATLHTGPRYFPWLQCAPMALLLAGFGGWGFLVADVLFQLLRWWLLYLILRCARVPGTPALWLAGLISLLMAWWLLPFIGSGGVTVYALDRLTRPLFTDLYLLPFLLCLLHAILGAPGRFPWRSLLGASVCLGLAPHGDFHGIFSLGPLWALTLAYCLWRERAQGGAKVLPGALLAALPAATGAAYWLLEVRRVPAEISARLGVYEHPRLDPFSPLDFYSSVATTGFLVALGAWLALYGLELLLLKRPRKTPSPILAASGLALLLTYLAPWTCLFLTGKLVQIYQFGERLSVMAGYVVLIASAVITQHLRERFAKSTRWGAWLIAPITAVLLLAALDIPAAREASRNQAPNWARASIQGRPGIANFRTDFRELDALLAQPAHRQYRVLATTDPNIYAWWLAATGKGAYTLDPFGTSLGDQEVEDRLLRIGRLCQAPDPDFITMTTCIFYFHSGAKYEFNRARTHVPARLLLPVEEQMRQKSPPTETWNLYIPNVEKVRLALRWRAILQEPLSLESIPFDLLVISRLHDSTLGEADPRFFRKILENSTLRVYEKRGVEEVAPAP